ncbi:Cytosolic Fe-S cluster assembly factor nar1 [Dimargaris verticillata]|uniref:Cytosolic Fe-S cluster assembly factor nar1 n=1 Tax=Dimargaris verticillata TaxID=2761393 RepID=A0A9W8AWY4_9FUNG|nr:Cytosolic Fe-S cluster assembly factor nar1 [Dimargaris verticillata]
MQSHHEFLSILTANEQAKAQGRWGAARVVVVSLSPQVIVSFAAKYGTSPTEAACRLAAVMRSLGVDFVFETGFARDLALMRIAQEFVDRYRQSESATAPPSSSATSALPMLASACPGWICYAEKSQPHALPYISRTKSPQQVMGAMVKSFVGQQLPTFAARSPLKCDMPTLLTHPVAPHQIYHLCVMPCYDKKLEASRSDFVLPNSEVKEVDCVISAGELELLLQEQSIRFDQVVGIPLDSMLTKHLSGTTSMSSDPDWTLARAAGTSSGGYLEFILAYAARQLFGLDLQTDQIDRDNGSAYIQTRTVRNPDFREVTLMLPDGTVGLKFAATYGFRNIQTLVRKLKLGRCPYQFVEVMACPSGCINGGGQLRTALVPASAGDSSPVPTAPETRLSPKEWVQHCESMYRALPTQDPAHNVQLAELLAAWLGPKGICSTGADQWLQTSYHAVEDQPSATVAVNW